MIKTVSGAQIDVQAMPHTDPSQPAKANLYSSNSGHGITVTVTRDEIQALVGALVQVWGALGEHGQHAHDQQ